MKKISIFLFCALLLCASSWAATYTMASGSRPACGGGWTVNGSTYTCGGTISLSNGDSIAPPSPVTINGNISVGSGSFSLSNLTLNGNFTASNTLSLTLSANTTINGSVSSTNSGVSIIGGTVSGSITNGGGNGISLQNTNVGGNVSSSCCSVTITGGSVAGNVVSGGGNGVLVQGGASIGGNVTSDCCSVTISASSVGGKVTSNGGNGATVTSGSTVGNGVVSDCCAVNIAGSTVSGTISTSGGNGINISNSTVPSGSISATNVPIVISNSNIGTVSSVNVVGNNDVTLSNGTNVFGNVTAGSWSDALTIDSSSTVYGTCTSNSNSTTNPPAYPRCNGGSGSGSLPATFNAFETTTASNAFTGPIRTKIAGSGFTLAIVALSTTGKVNGFTGVVKAELLANNATPGTGYSSNKCPTSNTVLQTITTPNFVSGRTDNATFAAVPEAYRDVRVRISYPAFGTPTVVICATDSFAIRPSALVPLVQDADWGSAGTTRTLDALTATAVPFHKAGQPFRIAITANNAASPVAVTNNYQGTSLLVNSLSALAPATVAGTLSFGTLSGSGTIVSTTASYSEVGAFSAVISDRTFAQIDSADTAADCNGFWICSGTFSVGRFVPDRLAVSVASLTPTCAASGKTAFTYTGAPFRLAFTLTAQNAGGGTTQNYAGTLAKLDPTTTSLWPKSISDTGAQMALGAANVPAVVTPANPAVPLGYDRFSVSAASGTWALGVASITATASFSRPSTPEINYEDFKVGIAPRDSEGVTVLSSALNLDTETPSPAADRVTLGSTAMRFGRLSLSNAFGSEKQVLKMPIAAQYWSGNNWVPNGDDSCTSLPATAFFLLPRGSATTSVSGTAVTLSEGSGNVVLTAPGAGNTGSVDIAANLGASGSQQSCLSNVAGGSGGTAANLPWLRSRNGSCAATYDRDPSARATFGIYSPEGRRVIHVRELF